jgi:hypothetical protein
MSMADQKPERKQKTKKGYEIPVPKRKDFESMVKRAAKGSTTRRTGK